MGISNVASNLRPGICTSTTRPTTPYEGQVIYETDTNRTLVWDNSAWVDPSTGKTGRSALVKITPSSATNGTVNQDGSVSFSAQSSFSLNGCFTSNFKSYRIIIVTTAVSANAQLLFRLRASGSDSSTAYYWGSNYVTATGGSGISNGSNATSVGHAYAGTTYEEEGQLIIDLSGVQETRNTVGSFFDIRHDSGATVTRTGGFLHSSSTSYDGFSYLIASGNMTGVAYVYGYN